MKRKMIAVIVTLSLLMMSVPLSVFAADNVSYMDESGNVQNCSSATDVTSSDTTLGTSGSETWYVVEGTVNINGAVIINGNVNLILCDDSELNVTGMIRVNAPNSFSVYGQSKSNGKLTAGKGGNTDASIGSCRWYACGTIKICGGIISATAGREGAGIGNAASQSGGSLYIYNGTVTATGGSEASGIGGGGVDDSIGNASSGMSVYIYGGHVTARGGASDIGGGMYAWNHGSLVGNIGHAIDAPRIYSNTNNFTGMAYNANNHSYTTYGNVVLDEDLNIDTSSTLNVRSNTSVKVPEGLTLTNSGSIENNGQILVDIGGTYSGNQPSANNVKYQIGRDNDDDGTAESYEYISYGSNLESSTTPTKPSTAEFDYSFEGWAPAGSSAVETTVSAPGIYHPIFTSKLRSYSVTVPTDEGYTVNYNGSQTVNYGADITFTVSISSGYFKGDNFAVKVNGNEYTPDSNGTYTVKIQGDTDISVEGVVMDKTAPVFSGIENGKTYCSSVEAEVADDNLDAVTVNGVEVNVDSGKFTVSPAQGEQTIVATDKAGNSTSYTITVNNGHTFLNYVSNNDATCTSDGTKTAKCEYCDATDTVTDKDTATGHDWSEPVWNWSDDCKTCNVTFTCKNDKNHVETLTANVTSAVKTEATCTVNGVTAYTASVEFNGATYSDTKELTDIIATGHNFENGVCTVCGASDPNYKPVDTETTEPIETTEQKETSSDNDTLKSKDTSKKSPDTGNSVNSDVLIAFASVCGLALLTASLGKKRKGTK